MKALSAPTLADLHAARDRIRGLALRTPLVRLNTDSAAAEIWLKLECLQPIGSFKLRGALNAMLQQSPDALRDGVYTASAGNMAQGVAWAARMLGVACRVIVPEHAPATKVAAVERLGGIVKRVSFDEWWKILVDHGAPDERGFFVHPVSDAAVVAGNGTIGLEIADELSDIDSVVVPYGGGGLSCGIAAAVRALSPRTRVFAAEVDTAAPLAASLAAGEPRAIAYTPSFVDGIGGKSVLPEMWPLAQSLLAGSLVQSLGEVAGALRLIIARNRVVSEGAGAAAVAAALAGKAGSGRVVCVISGGNIDADKLAGILREEIP